MNSPPVLAALAAVDDAYDAMGEAWKEAQPDGDLMHYEAAALHYDLTVAKANKLMRGARWK